jgi:hypothetical protein
LQIAGFSETYSKTSDPIGLESHVGKGVSCGFGFDAGSGRVHVKPELRYSHWIAPAFSTYFYLRPDRRQPLRLPPTHRRARSAANPRC